MKEILIPAAAIFSIFGLPIFVMLAAVVATMIEKPRWVLADQANAKEPVTRITDALTTNPGRVCLFVETTEKNM